MAKDNKEISVFDVLSAMPNESTKITYTTMGGRQLGKNKGGGAVIEFKVDNETFQDFAFQATYREPKSGKEMMVTMAIFFSKEEYERTLEKLKGK